MSQKTSYLTPAQAQLESARHRVKAAKEARRVAREGFDRALANLVKRTETLATEQEWLRQCERATPTPPEEVDPS